MFGVEHTELLADFVDDAVKFKIIEKGLEFLRCFLNLTVLAFLTRFYQVFCEYSSVFGHLLVEELEVGLPTTQMVVLRQRIEELPVEISIYLCSFLYFNE